MALTNNTQKDEQGREVWRTGEGEGTEEEDGARRGEQNDDDGNKEGRKEGGQGQYPRGPLAVGAVGVESSVS